MSPVTGMELAQRLEAVGAGTPKQLRARLVEATGLTDQQVKRTVFRWLSDDYKARRLVMKEPYRSAVASIIDVPADTFDAEVRSDRLDDVVVQLGLIEQHLAEVLTLLRAAAEESQLRTDLRGAADALPEQGRRSKGPRSSRATRRGEAQ